VWQTDGRTDRQTDRITITKTVQRIASHGKNNSGSWNSARSNDTCKWPRKTYPRTMWQTELHQFTLNAHLGWVNMSPYNFFVCRPKFIQFFAQRGRGCSWSNTLPICDTSIHCGDIPDKSRKLSEIAPNFGRCFILPNFRGPAFQKLFPFYHHGFAARRVE